MARITVEDCMEKVPNRFHLVQMAAIRTKQLMKGAQALVSTEENKSVVTSLREIAEGYVKPSYPGEVPATALPPADAIAELPAAPMPETAAPEAPVE